MRVWVGLRVVLVFEGQTDKERWPLFFQMVQIRFEEVVESGNTSGGVSLT